MGRAEKGGKGALWSPFLPMEHLTAHGVSRAGAPCELAAGPPRPHPLTLGLDFCQLASTVRKGVFVFVVVCFIWLFNSFIET